SRCYLWRWGCLYQLTRDHSLLRELIEERGMSPEQAGRKVVGSGGAFYKHFADEVKTFANGASAELAEFTEP
ncbi:acyl-CoA dehydrogenase, partial [Pseudomonas otitidis]|nr:acyl-CoA dehydrogenase [Pseudomonas otitidis]